MKRLVYFSLALLFSLVSIYGQSGRTKIYSESSPQTEQIQSNPQTEQNQNDSDDIIKIDTNLVIIPAQITDNKGKTVSDLKQQEFKIFENGVEQEIAYFSNQEQPFTVALVLDMSYSSVFKLQEIQAAAFAFVNQLRENDKVMVVSFDEKARVLCEPTNDRKVLKLAIEGAKIASGTSLYTALDFVLNAKFSKITGRKAVVLLSDGVDTSSKTLTSDDILLSIGDSDTLIYPIKYDTYNDVQKARRKNAEIVYDQNERPYVIEKPKVKGEREEDYRNADEFLKEISTRTGGSLYRVTSTTNLNKAFAKIADELRKIYSLGYYPSNPRQMGVRYAVNVRVYRPNLKIRAKESYVWQNNMGGNQ
ncbi:hypothetical protein BH10ACI1_BH10ACI1_09230 [soil metagenome]